MRLSCEMCGVTFHGHFNRKNCAICKRWLKYGYDYGWHVVNGLIKNPGQGWIGLPSGKENPGYRPDAKRRYLDHKKDACERCGSKKFLVAHHKDGQGTTSANPNNQRGNIETLCKKCHQLEHKAGQHLTDEGRRAIGAATRARAVIAAEGGVR